MTVLGRPKSSYPIEEAQQVEWKLQFSRSGLQALKLPGLKPGSSELQCRS